jgi:hypothetical protein
MGQGCQMALFQTKNPKLGKFWRFLQWKMLVYFTATWSIFLPFGIFGAQFVQVFFGYLVFFPVLVCCIKKSGNPTYQKFEHSPT